MRDLLYPDQSPENQIDPQKAAQRAMRRPLPKRFYKKAEIAACKIGDKKALFTIHLDSKPIKTPAKNPVAVPEGVAKLLCAEWQAQKDEINPAQMPVTRLVNSAIDGVADDSGNLCQALIDEIAGFAASDLVCYRAEHPGELVKMQSEVWDPVLKWAKTSLGAEFETATGIIHIAQSGETLDAFRAGLEPFAATPPFALAALHSMTTLTGSALIALATAMGKLAPEAGWQAAHIDEAWNARQWGSDSEAEKRLEHRKDDFFAAFKLFEVVH